MNDIIYDVANSVRQFDLSSFTATVAKHHREIGELNEAVTRANIRMTEIRGEIEASKTIVAADVADQLMAGTATAAIRPNIEALQEEYDLLRDARRELTGRIQGANNEVRVETGKMRTQLGLCLQPLGIDLAQSANKLAQELGEIYAACVALNRAGPNIAMSELLRKLEPLLEASHRGGDKLVPTTEPISVPDKFAPIMEVLNQLLGPVAAIPDKVEAPRSVRQHW